MTTGWRVYFRVNLSAVSDCEEVWVPSSPLVRRSLLSCLLDRQITLTLGSTGGWKATEQDQEYLD